MRSRDCRAGTPGSHINSNRKFPGRRREDKRILRQEDRRARSRRGLRSPVGAMALAAAPTTITPTIRCRFFSSPRKPLPLVTTAIKKFPSSPSPAPFLVLSGHRALRLSPLRAASSSFNGFAHPQNLGTKTGNFDAESSEAGFRERLVSGLVLVRSFLPGGSWWNFELEEKEVVRGGEEGKRERKKDLSVIVALRRMWMLVADDRWVIFLAFSSLMIAAVWMDILISSLIDILLEVELKWIRLWTA